MKTTPISVTEAARNFADCVNRVRYQNVTFVLLKNGTPVARLVPEKKKAGSVRRLAAALREFDLSTEEAKAWNRDLRAGRRILRPPNNKWR
ncbi:MAG: type II toxin-antitoxin system prevent-host-death family antitoxin [Candidatus Sulfotelmatobacter sp.]|jgi:prevent-host-death family protein